MSIIKINKMDIIGYEGKYKIYEDGRVWSYKREIFMKAFTNKIVFHKSIILIEIEKIMIYLIYNGLHLKKIMRIKVCRKIIN